MTMAMKMKAWAMVGRVYPTLSVPGIFSSATRPRSLSAAVVGAKEPIPRVSKKQATNPSTSSKRPGATRELPRVRARSTADSRTAM